MTRIALYPGSFDPLTNGHVDVLLQALDLFDKVVVAIGVHPSKKPLFSVEERVEMISDEIGRIGENARERLGFVTFSGLVVDAAR
ncbi:MAG TPA: adenylyltransferase/cytidyltransferase family protein, partial [Kaistiaceae bacterium]|nr:adenylyltransferase/cytidyltransferase family protein [Kaistiaceae bacterium]